VDRWRLLEGILATLGSQADRVLEFMEEEMVADEKPINIESLLAEVIPQLITLPGAVSVYRLNPCVLTW